MIDLKKLRENLDDFCTYGSDKVPAFSGREVRAIFEALEAAQEDAARYQWLRDNGIEKSFKLVQTGGVLMTVHSDATLDSAIDAAMASKA